MNRLAGQRRLLAVQMMIFWVYAPTYIPPNCNLSSVNQPLRINTVHSAFRRLLK